MLLRKMSFTNVGTELNVDPSYYLGPDANINLNAFLGRIISIAFTGRIFCVSCGKATKKSFGQGHCYPCFISVPETEECVLRPELCRAHEGVARNMPYAIEHCLVKHVVYIADSGGVKVGVTRYHQVPTRWVDQGATTAIKVLETANRYSAGVMEVALKPVLADKTNWRKMLRGKSEAANLNSYKEMALDRIRSMGFHFYECSNEEYSIRYPVTRYPVKVNTVSLDRAGEISGKLMGIKGQYLIFEGGNVINIRTHTGYEVELKIFD